MTRYSAVSDDSSSGVAELVPDLVVDAVVATAEEEEIFRPLARRFDLTGQGGDFIIPQAGALAWGALDASASVDPDEKAFNTNKRTITPSLHHLDVVVPVDVWGATSVNLEEEIAKESGRGLANYRNDKFAALYADRSSSPSHLLGTNGIELSFSDLRDSQGLLYTQKAPKPFAWVIHPTQLTELLKDDTFINAGVKGAPVLTTGVGQGGFFTRVLDVNIYVAEQCVEATGLHSMMFSEQAAIAYGFKTLGRPGGGASSEIMMDIEWNSSRRSVEINMTIHADFNGAKGSGETTANTWLTDVIS